jgi:murein DD-endopeptidase MepM/ murein hydrolase activator NlpD
VSLEQAKRAQQALLNTIAAQEDLIDQLQLGIIYLVNTERQDPGLGAAVTFVTSESPEGFLHSLATMESVTRLLEERAARFSSEKARLAEMKEDLDEQVGAIEAELERQRQLVEAQRAAAAAAAAALAKLSPEERAELEARITASGGVLPFTRPVSGNISLRFGVSDGLHSFHSGTDFANRCGTPIVAAASGTVIQAGEYSWEGYYTVIDHGRSASGNYYRTGYAHQLPGSILVTPGQYVERGEVIGSIGDSGFSFGCHLHWMVWENGSLVDGYYYIPEGLLQAAGNG